jgi:hypothetical protein
MMKKVLPRRTFLAGLATAPLAACGHAPAPGLDPTTINIVQRVSVLARGFCGALPTADTIAAIVSALLPALGPIGAGAAIVEQVALATAHAFCDALPKAVAQSQLRGGPRHFRDATGKAVTDYGPVIINGKPVPIQVYN